MNHLNVVEEVMQRVKDHVPEEKISTEILDLFRDHLGTKRPSAFKCEHPHDMIIVEDAKTAQEMNSWKPACGHPHLVVVMPILWLKGQFVLAMNNLTTMTHEILRQQDSFPGLKAEFESLQRRLDILKKLQADDKPFRSGL